MKSIKLFLIYICLLFPLTGVAQKKQLQTVRDQIKSGKELTKAENTLRGLLVDSASKKNYKIWLLLCDALTKQYEKILSLDGVELTFTEDALEEIADEALQRKTGARGLRAIIEKVMKRVMFEVPSMPEVTKCIVNRESVLSTGEPILKNEADQDIQLKS